MKALAVPDEEFDTLASGDGGTVGVLRRGRYSKRLLLLHELWSHARGDEAEAFAVLADAQKRARQLADEVVLDPHVGAWATACLGAAIAGTPIAAEELAHAGAVAAAAAWRTGLGFDLVTHAQQGEVFLPTLGTVDVGRRYSGPCRIRSAPGAPGVEVGAGDMTVEVARLRADRDAASWRPLRRIRCEAEDLVLDVAIDDLGPHRGCGELDVAGRLDDHTFDDWRDQLDQAWTMLVRHHRNHAEPIASGVVSLVPLRSTEPADELSATCHVAGGAVAMTTPRQPMSAALALVHEFQHTKLSALLDLVPLVDHSPRKHLHAPWRNDPRPLKGLFQGTYAFLGLTLFWDVRRRLPGPADRGFDPGWAEMEVALGRMQLAEALATLARSSDVRPAGQRFVDGMARRLAKIDHRDIAAEPRRLARLAARDHHTSWRLRNLRPDPEQVATMADDWSRGRSCRWPDDLRSDVADGGGPLASAARLALFRQHLAFPDRRHGEIPRGVTPADLVLIEHGSAAARSIYAAQVAVDPDDIPSWAGLVLSTGERTTSPATVLGTFPDWVVAIHRSIRDRSGIAPGPETLAAWIARS